MSDSDSSSDSAPSSPVMAPTPAAAAAASPAKKAKASATAKAKADAKGQQQQQQQQKKKKKAASVPSSSSSSRDLSFITGIHRMIDNGATHPELRAVTISSNGNALASAFAVTVLKRILITHHRMALHAGTKGTMTPFSVQRCLASEFPYYRKLKECHAFAQQRVDQFTRSVAGN